MDCFHSHRTEHTAYLPFLTTNDALQYMPHSTISPMIQYFFIQYSELWRENQLNTSVRT